LQLFSGGAAGTQPSEGEDRIRHGEGADKLILYFTCRSLGKRCIIARLNYRWLRVWAVGTGSCCGAFVSLLFSVNI
jgi:hypothetical protein